MLLSPKYLPRLAAVVGLFTRYGLRDVAERQGLTSLIPQDELETGEETREMREHAEALRHRLVELGPAYVKLGQVLSTRPDLLPQPYIDELEHLQDDVAPLPAAVVEDVLEEELGGRIAKLFGSFDPDPLGSASLGQVHAATLRDGRPVVVKVQRPGIREQLADELDFFSQLASFLAEHTTVGKRLDLVGVVQQAQRSLANELDYRVEARNAATFRRNLVEFPHILIPRIVEAYTTSRVLTMERIFGRKIDDIPPVTRVEYDFGQLASELARAYLRQITVDGYFHADPHPGNLFVVLPSDDRNPLTPAELDAIDRRSETRVAATPLARIEADARERAPAPPEPCEPKIALIDFGMTARLPERVRERVVQLLIALAENRGDEAADILIELGTPREDFDRTAYVREVATLVADTVDRSVAETATGRVLYEMIQAGYRHGLTLPAELTMLAKAVFNLDAVTRALDPSFNASEAIRDYAMETADQRARRDFSPRNMFQAASGAAELLRVLPRRVDTITERLAANELALRLDTPALVQQLEGMQKIANRIFTGLVLLGLLIASGLLMPYLRRLGIAGFVVAGGIGLYMVITILVTDRHDARAKRLR
jgi:predicted unusual protein kinase regulating ubiquinone biosynthesis (AarF/ABC1/UbiB family)